jgi:hypothetical protein
MNSPFRLRSPFPQALINSYESIPPKYLYLIKSIGEQALLKAWPHISAADYLDFSQSGQRAAFEKKYFDRRHILNDLVMAEYVTNSGIYLNAIIDALWSICEESGWQLPAHNNYIRDTPQLPLPNIEKPVLELFSCETAASLSIVYHLLGARLEKRVKGIQARILYELDKRIIQSYLHEHFWWMGHGNEPMCNWTSWCTQNILLVASHIPLSNENRIALCKKALKSIDFFLKDYDDDGCCDEGARYYSHAALCLYPIIETLNLMADHSFQALYKEQKIINMAHFIKEMHVINDYFINFSDCPPILSNLPWALVFQFGKRLNNPALAMFAAKQITAHGIIPPSGDLSLYTRLVSMFSINEIYDYIANEQERLLPPPISAETNNHIPTLERKDRYFTGVGIFVARDERICLAVKAGDNDDNHNHNDTGSISMYINGRPFLIDIGVGTYTKDTFSAKRYSIWTMQSSYHNLPEFDGYMQKAGSGYRAKDISYHFDEHEAIISMDIAGAYPKEAAVESYKRTVRLDKGGSVFLIDEFHRRDERKENPKSNLSSNKKITTTSYAVLNLLFCRQPAVIHKQNCHILSIEELGQIHIQGVTNIIIEEIKLDDSQLLNVWPSVIFRGRLSFAKQICLEIIPF